MVLNWESSFGDVIYHHIHPIGQLAFRSADARAGLPKRLRSGHFVPSGNRSAVDRLDDPAHPDATPAQPSALAVQAESR
jgi:hypothetical protein